MNFINFTYEQQKIVTDGLILNLDANNIGSYPATGSIWYDLSNSLYNSTIYNGSTFISGSGSYIRVDGISQYVDSGISSAGSNTISYTFGGWCKIVSNSTANRIYGRGANNWSLNITWLNSSGLIAFGVVTTNPSTSAYYVYTTSSYSVGTILHIIGVWDATNTKLSIYINGVFNNSLILSNSVLKTPSTGGWVIGTAGDYYPTQVSTFNVYNRVLISQEILQNYNLMCDRYGLLPNVPIIFNGLVLNLDAGNTSSYSGSGTTFYDLSGNNNNASLINSPTFTSVSNNGSYFTLNGSNQLINISSNSSLQPTNSITLESWFNLISIKSYNVLIAKPYTSAPWNNPYLSYMLRIDYSSPYMIIEFGLCINGVYHSPGSGIGTYGNGFYYIFTSGNVYNLVATYNAGNICIYVNGNLSFTTTITSGSINYQNYPVLIGADYGASPYGEYTNTKIYNTKIYNRALTDQEILQNFNSLRGRYGI